jgi:hypothetical protein
MRAPCRPRIPLRGLRPPVGEPSVGELGPVLQLLLGRPLAAGRADRRAVVAARQVRCVRHELEPTDLLARQRGTCEGVVLILGEQLPAEHDELARDGDCRDLRAHTRSPKAVSGPGVRIARAAGARAAACDTGREVHASVMTRTVRAVSCTLACVGAASAWIPVPGSKASGSGNSRVRITLENTWFGTQTYSLRCNPPGGTVPHPLLACSAINADPRLLVSPRPVGTCRGSEAIKVTGSFNGVAVHAAFHEPCPNPREEQDALVSQWLSFFPQWGEVRIDRGVGPLTLHDTRARATAILGSGQVVPGGLRLYRGTHTAGAVRFVSLYGVTYNRDGRVDTLISVEPELRVYGHYLPQAVPDARNPEPEPALRRWRSLKCAHIAARASRSIRPGVPVTIAGVIPRRARVQEAPFVIVTEKPNSACTLAEALRERYLSTPPS